MDPVYETRKQKIKRSKSKGPVYSKQHVRLQEKIKEISKESKQLQKTKKQ